MTYAIVVGFGIAQVGLDKPIIDPTLAVMEAITLVSAPLIVILLAAVSGLASPERKVFGVLALTFGAIMAGLTSAVHFVTLTAGRQMNFTTLDWPSTLYSVELLAWDVFLGLALVFAAPAVTGRGQAPVPAGLFLQRVFFVCLALLDQWWGIWLFSESESLVMV
ncbi:MAG: hypothetical protein IPN36_07105 [Bacteroidetes bacterium]|nr:hypothetical protein [Bacteroidota bacterium]